MRSRWLGFVVAIVALIASALAYAHLPERMPVHWNVRGEPDGYASKLVATALGPLAIAALTALMFVLPKIDPRGRNYPKFRDTYWLLVNGIVLFFAVIHAVVLAVGLGYDVRVNRVVPLGVGVLLVVLGNYLTRVQPNWFVGIRTPWTLSSDVVWRKTHRTGGWLFVAAGLITIALSLLPGPLPVVGFVVVILAAATVPIVQSYLLWRREQQVGAGERAE